MKDIPKTTIRMGKWGLTPFPALNVKTLVAERYSDLAGRFEDVAVDRNILLR
jgi:hypothetical protein